MKPVNKAKLKHQMAYRYIRLVDAIKNAQWLLNQEDYLEECPQKHLCIQSDDKCECGYSRRKRNNQLEKMMADIAIIAPRITNDMKYKALRQYAMKYDHQNTDSAYWRYTQLSKGQRRFVKTHDGLYWCDWLLKKDDIPF